MRTESLQGQTARQKLPCLLVGTDSAAAVRQHFTVQQRRQRRSRRKRLERRSSFSVAWPSCTIRLPDKFIGSTRRVFPDAAAVSKTREGRWVTWLADEQDGAAATLDENAAVARKRDRWRSRDVVGRSISTRPTRSLDRRPRLTHLTLAWCANRAAWLWCWLGAGRLVRRSSFRPSQTC